MQVVSKATNRLKELRGIRGLTLRDIARALGVAERTVNRWELHQNDIPRKHWEPLAQILDVQVPWLLGLEGNGNHNDESERDLTVA